MSITLHNRQISSTTISNQFLDYYMPQANGEFVKVYLYLLRCLTDSSMEVSICGIADKFNHTEKDVTRALRYWEQAGLLSLEISSDKKITDIILLDYPMPDITEKKEETAAVSLAADTGTLSPSPVAGKTDYTAAQLKHFLENEDISQILYIAQRYLGKTFSSSETNTILYFYDGLSFPTDLIEYLIEYCVCAEHKSMRYIEKVAISWAEKGIRTVAEAKAHTASYSQNCFSVMKAFGLSGRNPGNSEIAMIQKWYRSFGFSQDIILDACDRTIKTIHQPSFEYADSILTKWYSLGVKTLSDVAALDQEYQQAGAANAVKEQKPPKVSSAKSEQNRFNNITPRSYVYDDLEKQLLNH